MNNSPYPPLKHLMIQKIIVYLLLYIIVLGILYSFFVLVPTESAEFPILRLLIVGFASVLLTKYFFYMIISPWHSVTVAYNKYKYHRNTNIQAYEPKVSVLIPARNEENGVITTVKALLKSTYTNMEIIIINNGYTDNTEKNVKELIKDYYNSIYYHEPHIALFYRYEHSDGKGNALNNGLKRAQGDIIVSIDADSYVPATTIENFVAHFRDPKTMAAVGNVKIGNTHALLGVIQHLEFIFSFYFKKGDSLLSSIYIIGGAAGAFRKEVFKQLGGYNTTNITEDIQLSVRLQAAGINSISIWHLGGNGWF